MALSLRIKTTTYNTEIQDLIDACIADLTISGILQSKIDTLNTDSPDILLKRCVILYCKSGFGLDNKDDTKYKLMYDSLKIHLMLSSEYTVEVADV